MEPVFTLDKDIESAGLFFQGLAKVKKFEGKWGFIDKTGKVVIDTKYDYVESFNDDLALVVLYNEEGESQFGFINKKGEEVIQVEDKYEFLSSFSEGLAAYSNGDGWGFINKFGEKIIKANEEWDKVSSFCNGYASFKEDNEWGLIDKEGNQIIRNKYKYVLKYYNGLALILDKGKIGFINIDREEVIEPDFDEIGLPFLTTTAIVKDGNDFIFIGKDGSQVNKNEVFNVSSEITTNLYKNNNVINNEEVITSDYFDVDQIVNKVIFELSPSSFNNINSELTLSQVMKMLNILEEDLPKNKYQKYISLNDVIINNNSSYKLKVYFDSYISQPIIKKVKEQYGYYSYTTEKLIGYKLNQDAVISGIECTINLKNKGSDKGEDVAKVFKEKFESSKLILLKEESSENNFVFGKDTMHKFGEIKYENSKINFYLVFNP